MGTYTTNKNLYMPSVGEQGWGTLVNNNFSTIDTFLKPITVSGSTYTFTGNLVGNQSGGTITATSITNSGTSTFTGKITANGGIGTTTLTTSSTITSTGQIVANGGVKGNLTGNVTGNTTGFLFVKGTVGTSGDENYATLSAQSVSMTAKGSSSSPGASITVNNYSIVYGNPKKHSVGVYTRRSDLSGTTSPSASTRTITFTVKQGSSSAYLGSGTDMFTYIYSKKSTDSNYTTHRINYYMAANTTQSFTITGAVGATYQFYTDFDPRQAGGGVTISISAGTTYKVKYATP